MTSLGRLEMLRLNTSMLTKPRRGRALLAAIVARGARTGPPASARRTRSFASGLLFATSSFMSFGVTIAGLSKILSKVFVGDDVVAAASLGVLDGDPALTTKPGYEGGSGQDLVGGGAPAASWLPGRTPPSSPANTWSNMSLLLAHPSLWSGSIASTMPSLALHGPMEMAASSLSMTATDAEHRPSL